MIRGQKRALDKQPSVNVDLNASIHNRFDIEVIDARTGKVKQRAKAENVICNQMWDRLLSSNASNRQWNKYIHYGQGSGVPSASDASLFSFIAAVQIGFGGEPENVYRTDGANGVFSLTRRIILSTTDAVGKTITELGIGYSSASNSLCTHAMLQDMNGNQISILKESTDIINIYATVYLHVNAGGYQNGDIKIAFCAADQNFLARFALGKNGANFGTNDFLAYPSYGDCAGRYYRYGDYVTVTPVYNPSEKKIVLNYARLGADKGNIDGGFGGICIQKTLHVKSNGNCIPPTVIEGEAVGTGDGSTKDFKTKFSFAKDATVYVDGVADPTATVQNIPQAVTEMGRYFINIDEFGNFKGLYDPPADKNLSLFENGFPMYFENPYYQYGIVSANTGNYSFSKIYASDDLVNWTLVRENGNGALLSGHEYHRYYKFLSTHASSSVEGPTNFVAKDITANNIHFETAPPDGAVITIDYTSENVAKDSNHVFDFSLTIQFGEYTE